MDLIKAFPDNSQTTSVNIQGTHDEPLFLANQIGDLLEISEIRSTLADFDDDEKRVQIVNTPAGPQRVLFLTEIGLHRLLGMSRNPLARPFKKWVASTIKDIRMTGKYELEKSITERSQRALEEANEARRVAEKSITERSQRALEEANEARRVAEENAADLQTKLAGKYAPGQQIYVLMNPADAKRSLYKLGKTKDMSKRIGNYGTAMPDGCTVMHTVSCINATPCEQAVATALRKYQYNREWFQCDLGIITNAMETAVFVNDGLMRCIDHLEKYDVASKVATIFSEIDTAEGLLGNARGPPQVVPPRKGLMEWLTGRARTAEPQSSVKVPAITADQQRTHLSNFIATRYVKTDDETDRIKRKTVHNELEIWCRATGRSEILHRKLQTQRQLKELMGICGFALNEETDENGKSKVKNKRVGDDDPCPAYSYIKTRELE